jgi:hypothetical protein
MAHKPYLPGINKMERERQASEINTFISGWTVLIHINFVLTNLITNQFQNSVLKLSS